MYMYSIDIIIKMPNIWQIKYFNESADKEFNDHKLW